MSNNRLEIRGLTELMATLRALPDELAAEAGPLVRQAAEEAAADIRASYPRRTGDLADHVIVADQAGGRYGVVAKVENTSPHAWLFELGSQARHTKIGANKGSMPPGHVFVPRMMKHRRRLLEKIRGLMQSRGLVVKDIG